LSSRTDNKEIELIYSSHSFIRYESLALRSHEIEMVKTAFSSSRGTVVFDRVVAGYPSGTEFFVTGYSTNGNRWSVDFEASFIPLDN